MPPRRPLGYWRTRLVERDAGYITPCLEWTGSRHKQGYGTISIGGKTYLVHRLAWIETYGDPGPLLICHKCDNPPCARLDHLYAGTHGDNNHDAFVRGRNPAPVGPGGLSGERNGSSRLTEREVLAIRASQHGPTLLAQRYGVSRRTIHNILNRTAWRHLP